MLTRAHLLLATLPCLLLACNSGTGERDPVAEAKFKNEQRIENQDITDKQRRDAEFMVEAATGSRFGLELGQLAQRRATNPQLRALGQQMATDQATLGAALRSIGQQKDLVVPDALSTEQQETLGRLTGLSGPDLDRELLTAAEQQLDDAREAFDDMREEAYDGDIRALAAKYAATLKEHHDRADELADQLKP